MVVDMVPMVSSGSLSSLGSSPSKLIMSVVEPIQAEDKIPKMP